MINSCDHAGEVRTDCKMSLMDDELLLAGAVVGFGVFVVPSLIARRIAKPGLVIVIWLFPGCWCCAGL